MFVERFHTKPILTLSPSNKTAVIGENVTMRCGFLSDLNALVYWVKQRNISDPNYDVDNQKVHRTMFPNVFKSIFTKARWLIPLRPCVLNTKPRYFNEFVHPALEIYERLKPKLAHE